MRKDSKIFVAGHKGLVGSALVEALTRSGYANLVTRGKAKLDLRIQSSVQEFFESEKPDYVFLAAAKVGGIIANRDYPANFIADNLAIQTNVISSAHAIGVERLLFLGSSCIYPKYCPQPIKEKFLLTGELEPTNRPYAVAKIAGIEMCWAFNRQYGTNYLAVLPTNLYGPYDNYDPENSHVLPALIRKAHSCKLSGDRSITVWGSGNPRREFLYSGDLAEACLLLMQLPQKEFLRLIQSTSEPPTINIGAGVDLTIRELAETVLRVVGADAELEFDASKPDGTPQKLLDSSRINGLGWKPTTSLEQGLGIAYDEFLRFSERADHVAR